MYHFNDLKLAIRIADLQSISAAGRESGMSAASASAALQRLEKKLNCQLFVRSTRNIQLSEEGRVYIDSARKALVLLDNAANNLAESRGALCGELSIALPSDFGRSIARGWLDEFSTNAPDLKLKLHFGDQLTDLIKQKVDIALRYGQLDDSRLKCRQLALSHRVAVASPEYLNKYGRPNTPYELTQHKIILLNRNSTPWCQWKFNHKGENISVRVQGNKSCNDGAVLRDWALAGEGIAYKSWFDVATDVYQGRLELLLKDSLADKIPLQLVYLHSDYPSHKIRRVIDFILKKTEVFCAQYPINRDK